MRRITLRGLALASRNIIAALILLMVLALNAYPAVAPRSRQGDFGSMVASGRAAADGQNPYAVYPLTGRVRIPGFELDNPNLNPPVSLLFLEPLAAVDPNLAIDIWRIASAVIGLGCLVGLLLAYRPSWPRAVWAVVAYPFWAAIAAAQLYAPLMALTALAWWLVDRGRRAAAGLTIGLIVACKPNLGVWPVFLFVAGHRCLALIAGATALAVSLAPVMRYGPAVYDQWFALVVNDGARCAFPSNLSLVGLFARAGLANLGQIVALAFVAALALLVHRQRPAPNDVAALALAAALLASPIAWLYYAIVLWPALLRRPWNGWLAAGAALLVHPVGLVLTNASSPLPLRLTLGAVHVWALAAILFGLFLPTPPRRPPMSQRTEIVLLAAVVVAVILALILLPRTGWWREMQRLVPPTTVTDGIGSW